VAERQRTPSRSAARAHTDTGTAIYVGLVLWALGLLALLLVPALLDVQYASWRIATCVIGVVLGLMGLIYVRLRKQK
jgi:hypothetical protein